MAVVGRFGHSSTRAAMIYQHATRDERACLSPPPGPVGEAIITAQQPQVEVDEGRSQALGWIVTTDGRSVKAGGNPGSSSYMVIDSPHGRAIALAASRHGLAGELTEAANAALGRRDEAH